VRGRHETGEASEAARPAVVEEQRVIGARARQPCPAEPDRDAAVARSGRVRQHRRASERRFLVIELHAQEDEQVGDGGAQRAGAGKRGQVPARYGAAAYPAPPATHH
jgi:hypothetical protein